MIDSQTLRKTLLSRPIRVVTLVLGILTWLVFGVSILAHLINPMTWLDFWLAIYFGIAGVLAIVYFSSRRLWQLVVALPGVSFLGGFGTVGLLYSIMRNAT